MPKNKLYIQYIQLSELGTSIASNFQRSSDPNWRAYSIIRVSTVFPAPLLLSQTEKQELSREWCPQVFLIPWLFFWFNQKVSESQCLKIQIRGIDELRSTNKHFPAVCILLSGDLSNVGVAHTLRTPKKGNQHAFNPPWTTSIRQINPFALVSPDTNGGTKSSSEDVTHQQNGEAFSDAEDQICLKSWPSVVVPRSRTTNLEKGSFEWGSFVDQSSFLA